MLISDKVVTQGKKYCIGETGAGCCWDLTITVVPPNWILNWVREDKLMIILLQSWNHVIILADGDFSKGIGAWLLNY